jgi:hypothetical protein
MPVVSDVGIYAVLPLLIENDQLVFWYSLKIEF